MAASQKAGDCSAPLTIKRKRIMIYFIEATQKLIQSEGVDGLSIRKIATEAGYNSATIYNYFRDLEHLTLFGSACYLRGYVVALSESLKQEMNSLERFRTIYRCFNNFAFRNPDIFHSMFFGRHSGMLGEVLHTYYHELFPEELSGLSEPMQRMIVSGSMMERDRVTIQAMVEEGFIAPEKAEVTQKLIVAAHQNVLYEACLQDEDQDTQLLREKFDQMFEYLLAAGK